MRKMFAVLSVASFVAALAAPALAKTETVKGQVVDESCYAMDKSNNGLDHKMKSGDTKDCAVACAKRGRPLALLTSEGKVYEITGDLAANNNEKLVPHVAHTIEVTGDVSEKDGKTMIAGANMKMISK
jgi:hypothetical protein